MMMNMEQYSKRKSIPTEYGFNCMGIVILTEHRSSFIEDLLFNGSESENLFVSQSIPLLSDKECTEL